MNVIILSALSPRFNTIGTLRIEKLAKYLSTNADVQIIAGMPLLPENSPYLKKKVDIGSAELIEIPARRLKHDSRQSDRGDTSNQVGRGIATSVLTKMKFALAPLAEYLFPLSPGGIIWHDKKAFEREVESSLLSMNEEQVIMISSFGPWFTTKLAMKLKKRYKKRVFWVADFRDPSFGNVHSVITHSSFARRATKKILDNCDLITCVNHQMIDDYSLIANEAKYLYLPNGYDPSDIEAKNIELKAEEKNNIFNVVYTGSFYPNFGGDIGGFCAAVKNLKTKDYEAYSRIIFSYAGKDSKYVSAEFDKAEIAGCLRDYGLVDRRKALELQYDADLLLLITYTGDNPDIGKGVLTGKCYEYLSSCKPILMIGSEKWELRKLLESDGISRVFRANEVESMSNYMREIMEMRKTPDTGSRQERLKGFEYPNLALKLFEELTRRWSNTR